MKTVAEHYGMQFDGPDRSGADPSHDAAMGRIGEDLRDHYREVTETEQPRALLAMAQALDARLSVDDLES